VRLAIVADDLTGALDVSAPVAARGLRVVVATTPGATVQAINSGAEVVVVNTASREGSAENAREAVAEVSRKLALVRPEWALKKVDSRLKGHVAVEVAAMMEAFGRSSAIVAPAVPSQGRTVAGGHVIGNGVTEPISISGVMGALPHEAPDTADAAALAEVARNASADALLVGASGLGVGLGQLIGRRHAPMTPVLPGPLLVAVGSHDPITLRQVEVALGGTAFNHIVSRDGALGSLLGGPSLVQAVVSRDGSFGAAMARFGRSIADLLRDGGFGTVLLTGGETAQSVLGELGVGLLEVLGEVLPGIPVTRAALGDRSLTILTKSGGFGTPQDILRLASISQGAATAVTGYAFAGGQ
jgi:uncharacterized protein YgbK (DUF1537 family)